ncbi:hypothetical protein ACIQ6R_09085 [Streptomyces sp. NPDC096048]|uniref:hypothetical protein n=1 Tax=Streptomyces sp. NPDC096048 TaxID=3366072 RepID=UPI0038024348
MASWEWDEGAPEPVRKERAARSRKPGGVEPEPGRTHVSTAGLRARGWTAGMVRRLLGEPDLLRAHPYVRSAPPTRLYAVERVEAVERGAAFRAASAAAARRSTAVRAAARRRARELRARMTARPGGGRSGKHPDGTGWGNSGAGPVRRTDDREVDRSPPQEPT